MAGQADFEPQRHLFDVTALEVIEGAACTWCGSRVGAGCRDWKWKALHAADHTHAQRWRDYWNATNVEQTAVHPAPWLIQARS